MLGYYASRTTAAPTAPALPPLVGTAVDDDAAARAAHFQVG